MSSAPRPRRLVRTAVVTALLAILYAVLAVSARQKSITYDEPRHFRYGLKVLEGDTNCIDDSKMPVSALNAAPYRLARHLDASALRDFLAEPSSGRHVTMLCSLLLGLLVYAWARSLYGFAGGLLALMVYILSPNLLAHARWITTDLYAALTIPFALWAMWRFLTAPRFDSGLIAGLALGLAQVSKFSAVWLYPLLLVLATMRMAPAAARRLRGTGPARLGRRMLTCAGWAVLILAVSLLVLNAAYLFRGTGTSLEDYAFQSELFRDVTSRLGPFASLPLPLPQPWLVGLDWVKHHEATGQARGPTYFMGERRTGRFAALYPLTFLLKIPLAVQILVLLALVQLGRARRRPHVAQNEGVLLLAAGGYAVYFIFFCRAQLGIRLTLMILPLLHVLIGGLARDWSSVGRGMRRTLAVLLIWLAVSTASYAPHFLSYVNELVPDRKNTYRIFADSNLDWGQNEHWAREYARAHPGTHWNPTGPVTGRLLISANYWLGLMRRDEFRWCEAWRDRLQPIEHVAYSYLVFEVPDPDSDGAR